MISTPKSHQILLTLNLNKIDYTNNFVTNCELNNLFLLLGSQCLLNTQYRRQNRHIWQKNSLKKQQNENRSLILRVVRALSVYKTGVRNVGKLVSQCINGWTEPENRWELLSSRIQFVSHLAGFSCLVENNEITNNIIMRWQGKMSRFIIQLLRYSVI